MAFILNYTTPRSTTFKPPTRRDRSVGYDLYAPETLHVPAFETLRIDTGLVLEMQGSFYAQLESVPEHPALRVVAGVVDPGYRGSVTVVLLNATPRARTLGAHDRIAQILFTPVLLPELVYKEDEDEDLASDEMEDKLKTYLKYSKTSASAIEPTRFDEGCVGYDLHALHEVRVPPSATVDVDTGILLALQGPFYAQIRDKFGFSTRKSLYVVGGGVVVDASHRSSIRVRFENTRPSEQRIFAGETMAQLIFVPAVLPTLTYQEDLLRTRGGMRGFAKTCGSF